MKRMTAALKGIITYIKFIQRERVKAMQYCGRPTSV